MLRRENPTLSKLREQAWRQAHQLSSTAADVAPPVALHRLASELQIRGIELLPMLCTAAIGPVDDGYVIYINTTANGAERIRKKRLELTEEDFRCLNVSLRFCIAHEMAHVLFFTAAGGDCRNKLLQDHWRALENSCSQMARVILLPRDALLREIGRGLFARGHLVEVVKRFQVSPAVFIYRFHVEDMSSAFQTEHDGLIACVHSRRDEPNVIATHALGSLGRIRWPKDERRPDGLPLKELCLSVEIRELLRRKEHVVMEADVFWRQGQVAPCSVEIQWYNAATAILSIRMHGHLEKRSGDHYGRIHVDDNREEGRPSRQNDAF